MRKSLRVVHVVPAMFSPTDGIVGGAERYVHELARHMAESAHTTLLSFGNEDRTEVCGPLRIRVLGHSHFVRGQRSNPISAGLLGELRKADTIHCHQQHVVASSVSAAFGRLTGKRVFVTDLGGGGWDVSGYVSTDNWYRGHLHISEYSRRIFGHAESRRARVILGGVDTTKFSPDASVVRDGSVLFVGRLAPHKGIDVLIESMPADVRLDVIGRPFDDAYLRHLYTLSEGRFVVWHHDCDDAALVQAYRRASCVVLPSVYESAWSRRTEVPELLGQTLLEAMACGAPVVCTNVASMPEIVLDGHCGAIVPPNDAPALGDAVRRIARDSLLGARLGSAGRLRTLQTFTWQSVVDRCMAAYAS